jgi:ribokinase
VAAVQLRKLAGSCLFLTALGADEIGQRADADLRSRRLQLDAAWRPTEPQRRAVVFLDNDGERTITVLGDRLVPRASDALLWGELASHDAVYLTAGDVEAVKAARTARVLVATTRAPLRVLAEAGVELDALVASARDPGERYTVGDLPVPPRYVVLTDGSRGGTWQRRGEDPVPFHAEPLPGPIADAYGAGDSFAAGVTYGLGAGMDIADAVRMGARCGAANMTGRGAYEGQLELSDAERELAAARNSER